MTVAKKILVLVGDYAEDYETVVPFQVLQVVGHQMHVVCSSKRAGRSMRTAIHDFKGDQTYSEKPGYNLTLNVDFAQARVEDCDALLIPGGRAPEYLHLNEQVLALMCAFDAARKPIAAVYHGTQLLAAIGVLQGRTCSAYPACALEVWLVDGEYVDISSDQVYVDGRLVTVPTWPAHPTWSVRFLEVLGTRVNH